MNNIKRIELAGTVRKFISRYLAGKRSQSEIGEDKMLFEYLTRVDLWERNIDDPKFEKEFFELSKFKITVGEAKDFYDKLGGDMHILDVFEKEEEIIENNKNGEMIEDLHMDKNEIIIDPKKEEDEEEEKEDEEENKINKKPKVNRRKLF